MGEAERVGVAGMASGVTSSDSNSGWDGLELWIGSVRVDRVGPVGWVGPAGPDLRFNVHLLADTADGHRALLGCTA